MTCESGLPLGEEVVPPPTRPRLRPTALAIPLVALIMGVFAMLHGEEVKVLLDTAREWTARQGLLGVFVFGLSYAVALVFFVPGNVMTTLATALFGPLVAIVVVSISGTIGATLCFLIARYGVRDWVAHRLAGNFRFHWLEENTAKKGALFVAVARVLPIMPGNVLHYAFGLTRIPLGVFIFWSMLASLPGLVLFATGLDAVFRLASARSVPPSMILALAALLSVKVLLIVWAARQAGVRVRRPLP